MVVVGRQRLRLIYVLVQRYERVIFAIGQNLTPQYFLINILILFVDVLRADTILTSVALTCLGAAPHRQ